MIQNLNGYFQTDPNSLSPLAMFAKSDGVVQVVMILLILASIWTWTIIISQSLRQRKLRKISNAYEQEFWESNDIDAFAHEHRGETHPMARVLGAGLSEWRMSTGRPNVDREGTRSRLSTALGATAMSEVDQLSDRLNFLATVGSVAPFVGLFGTVWGIMRSFAGIVAQQNTGLAAVAPGIAEALFATALGLFAAIPAVIGYNRLSHGVNRLESHLNRFADGFHATLSRELDN